MLERLAHFSFRLREALAVGELRYGGTGGIQFDACVATRLRGLVSLTQREGQALTESRVAGKSSG